MCERGGKVHESEHLLHMQNGRGWFNIDNQLSLVRSPPPTGVQENWQKAKLKHRSRLTTIDDNTHALYIHGIYPRYAVFDVERD